jgi:tellurium resistance protein TerZ
LDNEVITVDFSQLEPNVEHVAMVLNSYRGQDFGTIPFASIRIYEGTPTNVKKFLQNMILRMMLLSVVTLRW